MKVHAEGNGFPTHGEAPRFRHNTNNKTTNKRLQQIETSAATQEKEQVRFDFQDALLDLADPLSSLARRLQDSEMASQCGLTVSAVDIADDRLEAKGDTVLAFAQAHAAALADYGVTPAEITSFEELLDRFSLAKNAPRRSIADHKAETEALAELIREIRLLLQRHLDKQVRRLRHQHPEFYAGYRSARTVIDRGGRSRVEPATPPAPVTAVAA